MTSRNRLRLIVAAIALAFSCAAPLVPAAEPWQDAAGLDGILGAAADWKITPAPAVLHNEGGATLSGAGATLNLESAATHTLPTECLLTFRLKPGAGQSCYITVHLACGERADKSPQELQCYVGTTNGQKYIACNVSVLGGKPPSSLISYQYPEAVNERSLTWPEELRKTVEVQIAAAPKIEEMLMTLRCVADKNRFRTWLNGRFIGELLLDANTNPTGLVKIQTSPNTELASVRFGSPPPFQTRFEPLSIAGNLNGASLDGGKVDPASLPGAPVDGVPFQFPAANARGEDHIDVGQSWTRFGALPGFIAASSGTFGGRWISADRMDPARIAMYIPKGRYKALHLIAVADPGNSGKASVPIVTAQFYRPDAGHPFNFEGKAPTGRGDAGDARPVPVKLANGKTVKLYHVVIPLDPDAFSWFTDLDRIAMEITKQVQYYRAYPDPLEYSWHGAGLPSSVQIYAMTLERVGVDVEIVPEHYGHFWTAPETPHYTIELRNSTGAATAVKLVITTRSHDGIDVTRQEHVVPLPADGALVKFPVELKPTRYGLQEMTLNVTAGEESATYRRSFAFLHPETRDQDIWQSGRGSIFGFWATNGWHGTPSGNAEVELMAAAGAETSLADYNHATPEIKASAVKHRFITENAFEGSMMYYNAFIGDANAPKWDPLRPEESAKSLIEKMRKYKFEPSATCRPTYLPFFPEPQIGPISCAVWPSHYGEDYHLSPDEQKAFDTSLAKFLAGARAVRKEWPNIKILLPYGDPMYTAIFLRLSPEARELIDGCALDLPGFERLPEQQVHQVVLSRLQPIMEDIRKYKPNPYFVLIEGTSISSVDIDTGQQGQADICTRDFLLLMGYGVTRFESSDCPFDCADYWGENHYGGGWCSRMPVSEPKMAYVNYATLTRHLNRANFTQYIPTGSTSTYCEQFKHYRTGKLIHVLWTVRGRRVVNIKADPGATMEIYDQNDNAEALKEKGGVISFSVDHSPKYLEGMTSDPVIALGESDQSDASPAEGSRKIANLGHGWKLVEDEDLDYAKNKPLQIERFPGKMTIAAVAAPGEQGGKALAVHLEKQAKDRGVMPFYTTLEPRKPIVIEGKASHLGLWVHAASDWGRVVYCLRDAKGERWISVGAKEDWNDDDVHGWSAFCFDGWRYLRFELPSNAPYDCFREYGSSWWGAYGGDGVVDLPLTLEKIIVERRPKVVYGNALVDARPDDVFLGDLYAEYASASDKDERAVALSRLRMPIPRGAPDLGNPIADFAKTSVGAPTKVVKVADPEHEYDGTRCLVFFDPVPGAKGYNVWVSPYADGRGAMLLGTGWTEPGKLIEGLRPGVPFYLFIVYTDKDGKLSKPSDPFPFKLKDRFGYK